MSLLLRLLSVSENPSHLQNLDKSRRFSLDLSKSIVLPSNLCNSFFRKKDNPMATPYHMMKANALNLLFAYCHSIPHENLSYDGYYCSASYAR